MKGWGPKSSICPLGGISQDFAGISRRRPKSLRKKMFFFCVQFLAPRILLGLPEMLRLQKLTFKVDYCKSIIAIVDLQKLTLKVNVCQKESDFSNICRPGLRLSSIFVGYFFLLFWSNPRPEVGSPAGQEIAKLADPHHPLNTPPQGPCHIKNTTVIVIHYRGGKKINDGSKTIRQGLLKHLVFQGEKSQEISAKIAN